MSTPSAPEKEHWAKPPLSWLPAAVLVPRNPFVSIGVGWLMTFPASLVLARIVQLLAPHAQTPAFPVTGFIAIFLIAIFSPVVETLIMAGALSLLLRFVPPRWAVLASSACWGLAHSLAAPSWGLVIWWPFLVFSTLFVTWRQRSLGLALLVPMTVHALQNLPPAVLIAMGVQL